MIARQGEMLANRVKKRFAYLSKKFFRENIEAFRLYDWDIPEIRAVVDWYAGHIVIAEYTRTQSPEEWLPAMAEFVAKALGIQVENVHIKRRRTAAGDEPRYRRLGRKGQGMVVRERDMRFRVNLTDFIDTGLFPDHRNTREIVRRESKDRDFLNLFCYSGAFTCYAASGGARATVSVDRSETAVKWARDNLDLNGLTASVHEFVQSDVFEFLKRASRRERRFDLAVVDPPSFFNDRARDRHFDVLRDHPELLKEVVSLMKPGSILFFSTNHQRFEPSFGGLNAAAVKELTPATIPEDYRNRKIHRCWRITV